MFEAITLTEAKALKVGQTVYAIKYYNRDGTAQRFTVQGTPKTWKRKIERVEVTLKRGVKEFVTLTNGVLMNSLWLSLSLLRNQSEEVRKLKSLASL